MSESNSDNRFMTVRKVAEYMQLNEKGIQALTTKEKISETKNWDIGCYHVNFSIARCSNLCMEEFLLTDW